MQTARNPVAIIALPGSASEYEILAGTMTRNILKW
jgi:hypothetical protein